MENEQLAVKLQEVFDRSLRNEGRIKKLEAERTAMHDVEISVIRLEEKLTKLGSGVDTLVSKVETLEQKPAKRWDGVVEKVILTIVAALIGFLLAQAGIA